MLAQFFSSLLDDLASQRLQSTGMPGFELLEARRLLAGTPVVMLDVLDPEGAEAGQDIARLRVVRGGLAAVSSALSVDLTFSGSAQVRGGFSLGAVGGTLTARSGAGAYTVHFPAGTESVEVVVTPTNDAIPESDQQLIATLNISPNYSISPVLNTAEVSIRDDDRPLVSLNYVTTAGVLRNKPQEGTEETSVWGFCTLDRTGDLSQPVTVHLMVDPVVGVPGIAQFGVDYGLVSSFHRYDTTAAALDITLPAGRSQIRVYVVPILDEQLEDETLHLTLTPGLAYDVDSNAQTVQMFMKDPATAKAAFEWKMQERYGIDSNGKDGIDLPNSSDYANPGTFKVEFDGSSSTGNVVSYEWKIGSLTATGVRPIVSLRDDTEYNVQLTVTDAQGNSNTTTQKVYVNDILIVSLGDSYASGEGNPVTRTNHDLGALVGATDFLSPTAKWADGLTAEKTLENARAHRSPLAGTSLAAIDLERSDPHTSVTFVFLAQTGAQIVDGLILPRTEDVDRLGKDTNFSQVWETKEIIGNRKIDAMYLSIGGNDIGFGDLLAQYVTRFHWEYDIPLPFPAPPIRVTGESKGLDDIKKDIDSGLGVIAGRYKQLKENFDLLLPYNMPPPEHVYVTGYPNPAGGDDGKSGVALQDLTGTYVGVVLTQTVNALLAALTLGTGRITDLPLQIDAEEAEEAVRHLLNPLNDKVKAAAESNHWTFIPHSSEWMTHGYSSSSPWVRTANQSRIYQGGRTYPPMGAAHPNEEGHRQYRDAIEAHSMLGLKDSTVSIDEPTPAGYRVNLGNSVTLKVAPTVAGVRYEWDLDYNGTTFNPTATGATALFTTSAMTFPTQRRVAVRATDAYGRVAYDYTTVQVLMNLPGPLNGPQIDRINPGTPLRVALQASKLLNPVYAWVVTTDGDETTVPGDWTVVTRTFETPGPHSMSVTAITGAGPITYYSDNFWVVPDDSHQQVWVGTIGADANEGTGSPGVIRVGRTGAHDLSLSVPIEISTGPGFAENGVDFVGGDGNPIPNSVVIPAGQEYVDLAIHPVADTNYREGTETVRILARPSYLYSRMQSPTSAEVLIADAPIPGNIIGHVYEDANRNNVLDSGEKWLSGRTMWLDYNNNKLVDADEPKTVSDANGRYTFGQLRPGFYNVRQWLGDGWTQSTPGKGYGYKVALASGMTYAKVLHGAYRTPGSISGRVFFDRNYNGVFDGNDEWLGGRRVWLDTDNDQIRDSGERTAVTDANGAYTIEGLNPGVYNVRVTSRVRWAQSTPVNDSGYPVDLKPGQKFTEALHGMYRKFGSISGRVFNDVNHNRLQDPNERGMDGRRVWIDLDNDQVRDLSERTALTDAGGSFTISGLPAGTYSVRLVLKTGWVQTTPRLGGGFTVNLAPGEDYAKVLHGAFKWA